VTGCRREPRIVWAAPRHTDDESEHEGERHGRQRAQWPRRSLGPDQAGPSGIALELAPPDQLSRHAEGQCPIDLSRPDPASRGAGATASVPPDYGQYPRLGRRGVEVFSGREDADDNRQGRSGPFDPCRPPWHPGAAPVTARGFCSSPDDYSRSILSIAAARCTSAQQPQPGSLPWQTLGRSNAEHCVRLAA